MTITAVVRMLAFIPFLPTIVFLGIVAVFAVLDIIGEGQNDVEPYVIFPVLTIFLWAGSLGIFAAAPLVARWFVPANPKIRCPACNYRIEGLTEPRCPECGVPLPPEFMGEAPGGIESRPLEERLIFATVRQKQILTAVVRVLGFLGAVAFAIPTLGMIAAMFEEGFDVPEVYIFSTFALGFITLGGLFFACAVFAPTVAYLLTPKLPASLRARRDAPDPEPRQDA
ncbi:MAG: hypothetical protein AAGI17_04275 [Planctomycetota bacterium]